MRAVEIIGPVALRELLNLPKQPIQQQQPKPLVVQSDATKQQQTVGKLVNQMAADDNAAHVPTEMDKVLAMMKYSDLKKQANARMGVKKTPIWQKNL
jgi:hypothetical protein